MYCLCVGVSFVRHCCPLHASTGVVALFLHLDNGLLWKLGIVRVLHWDILLNISLTGGGMWCVCTKVSFIECFLSVQGWTCIGWKIVWEAAPSSTGINLGSGSRTAMDYLCGLNKSLLWLQPMASCLILIQEFEVGHWLRPQLRFPAHRTVAWGYLGFGGGS